MLPLLCPIGSSCDGNFGAMEPFDGGACGSGRRGWGWGPGWRGGGCGCGYGSNRWGWGGYNWLGSVAEIPCSKIVNFTHSSI